MSVTKAFNSRPVEAITSFAASAEVHSTNSNPSFFSSSAKISRCRLSFSTISAVKQGSKFVGTATVRRLGDGDEMRSIALRGLGHRGRARGSQCLIRNLRQTFDGMNAGHCRLDQLFCNELSHL